jgi:hypothetical protein
MNTTEDPSPVLPDLFNELLEGDSIQLKLLKDAVELWLKKTDTEQLADIERLQDKLYRKLRVSTGPRNALTLDVHAVRDVLRQQLIVSLACIIDGPTCSDVLHSTQAISDHAIRQANNPCGLAQSISHSFAQELARTFTQDLGRQLLKQINLSYNHTP